MKASKRSRILSLIREIETIVNEETELQGTNRRGGNGHSKERMAELRQMAADKRTAAKRAKLQAELAALG